MFGDLCRRPWLRACSPTPDTVMMSCVWRALGGAVGLEGSALTRVTFFFCCCMPPPLLARRKVEKAPFFLTSSNNPLAPRAQPSPCAVYFAPAHIQPSPAPPLKCFRVFFNDAVSDGRSTSATPSAPPFLRASPSLRLAVCVWVGSSCEALGICPLYSTSTSKCMIWVFPS